ncbi:MAG TPA: glycosyltransferase family 2 protein [Pyrinomonadaceae bacterium]|jgi:glycosyltransferase involved in cell wall biosynthesis
MKTSPAQMKSSPVQAKPRPFVSLIMPVRNEAGFIARGLEAVLGQDYPAERMEVLVVDGMSDDGTREVVSSFAERYARLRLLDNPGRIVPTGLNLALREATGEIIVRVDGHCEIAPDYVSRSVQCLEEEEADGVGGPIETIGDTRTARAIALAMSSKFGVGGSAFRTIKDRRMFVETVAFPAYTRRAIERAGLFDEELVRNQDDEYNYRLCKLGGRLLLAPEIRSRYYSRSSFRSLWRQYFQYGYWKVRVMQKHPRQMRLRQFAPPLFVASLAVALTLAPFSVPGALALGLLLITYALLNLAASVIALRGVEAGLLPLLLLAHPTLHLSYGAGFLVGLVRFWNRWAQGRSPSGEAVSAERDLLKQAGVRADERSL